MATWDVLFKTKPLGSDSPAEGDDRMRETRAAVEERIENEHVNVNDGISISNGAAGQDWWHREGSAKVYYVAAASAPTTRPDGATTLDTNDEGRVYITSDTTPKEIFIYTGSAWAEVFGATTYLNLSGAQTISGVKTFSAQPIISTLTASQAVFTDASKGLVSNAITGTGNVVMSASPTLTGTIGAASMTLSGTLGVTGIATFTAAPVMTALTASVPVFTGAGKALASNAMTGTGNVVMSASPTLTGTITAAAANFSGAVGVDGNFDVANTMFTVAAATGNTSIAGTLGVTGAVTGTLATAAQGNITSLGTLTILNVDNLRLDGNTLSATTGAVNITPVAGSAILLDATISIDAGVVTGATSITSTTFVGNLTGNASGTAATVTGAAQAAITSLGTLTILNVDNLRLDGNTLSATTGAVNITPVAGSAIVLDGTINVDAGVVTGATSITSTAFVGNITGNVTGNASGTAATVTTAAQPAITSVGTLTGLTVSGAASFEGNLTFGNAAGDTVTVNSAAWTIPEDLILTNTLNDATGNEWALKLAYTVNKATSGTDTGLIISMTDTASPGTSKPIDIFAGAAGTTELFYVDASGNAWIGGTLTQVGAITTTSTIGRDADNNLSWGTDDQLDIEVAGVTLSITAFQLSTGTPAQDTTLVTKGYVTEQIASVVAGGVALASTTDDAAGIVQLATSAESVAGTDAQGAYPLVVQPSHLSAKLAAPGAIGGTTAAAGTFTTLTATTSLSVSDGNITNVGDIALDSISADGTTINIALTDNIATALTIKEGATAYLTFVTTDAGETITLGKKLTAGAVEIEGSAFDIDGGNIDGTTIATSNITVGVAKTLDVSAGTLTLADNQISGDKVEGGTIAATTITALTISSMAGNWTNAGRTVADLGVITTVDINGGTLAGVTIDGSLTWSAAQNFSTGTTTIGTVDINAGAIDGTIIGGASSAAAAFTTVAGTTITATTTVATDTVSERTLTAGVTIDGILLKDTTISFDAGTTQLACKVIDIGDWNMDSTASINVAHGLNLDRIVSMDVTIRNDASSQWWPLDYTTNADVYGYYNWNATNVVLIRGTGFDSVDFDSTSYNRGRITMWHRI